MPAGVGCLTRPAWGCLGYPIFILGAVLEARSPSFENNSHAWMVGGASPCPPGWLA